MLPVSLIILGATPHAQIVATPLFSHNSQCKNKDGNKWLYTEALCG